MLRIFASETSSALFDRSKKNSSTGAKRIYLSALLVLCACLAFAAIAIPLGSPYVQNFDSMGTPATTGTASTLPADFRVDNPATVRTVGNFATASTTVARAGGANLSTTAANGIYNFGAGNTSLGNSDRAVGFLSSGSATESGNLYAQLVNNTAGSVTGLQISYNVEKYRNGINPAGYRIQLFYSTDGATWTDAGPNFTTAFVGDTGTNTGFATVPGATVAVTNQTLPVSIPAGATFYLAWNYSVTSGTTTTNGQALAVDDISILGLGNVTTNPSATGASNPSTVQAGNSSRLTVQVTPGANPSSTGITVTADLSSISGGSAAQKFFDDGSSGGDQVAGDNIFTFNAPVPSDTAVGVKTFAATITDAQGRTASTSISLNVTSATTPPSGVGSANPASLMAGSSTLLTVTPSSGSNPPSSGLTVTANLGAIGGSSSQQFFDDGTNGDAAPGDGIFSFSTAVASGTSPGSKSLQFTVSDAQSRSSNGNIALTIQPPPPPNTVKISQVYGGGGNSGATYTNDFIELFNDSSAPVDISGWSVQYSSSTLSAWTVTPICPQSGCVIQPYHYFLVEEGPGTGGTTAPPPADIVGTLALGAGAGKVALVGGIAPLNGCPALGSVVDFVGYGAANCSESVPTAVLGNTLAAIRKNNGCTDTDNNQNDFIVDGPIPRNSSSPANFCGAASALSGQGLATPDSELPVTATLLTVAVTLATGPPGPSTGVTVVADLSSFNGNSTQAFYDDGTHGDATAGDSIYSFSTPAPLSTGLHGTIATITDAQGRTATAPITMTVISPTCGVERWTVKVGTDPDAGSVDLTSETRTTVADLGAITAPANPPDNARVTPYEFHKYVINGNLREYKLETDVDYHVVVDDGAGRTMVVEIPNPACVLDNRVPRNFINGPFNAAIAAARQKFDAKLTATTTFQFANIPVQIKGVAFFDFEHGQTGIAPNGIELHPVLEINFPDVSTTTLASNLNPAQFNQNVTLTATVTNAGSSTPTGNVTFQDGGTPIGVAPVNASGQASFTTNSLTVGTHSLRASYEGDSGASNSVSAPLLQTVNPADQAVTLDPIANHVTGDAPFAVHAVASSGLPVSYNIISGPATISGSIVTLTGTGTVVVQGSQAGDGNYNAASATQSFNVATPFAQLTFVASTLNTGSGYVVTLTVKNPGNVTLTGVSVIAAAIGSAGGTPLPQALGTIAANGGTATATLNFPLSAGAPKTAAIGKFTASSSSGNFSASVKMVLPAATPQ